jgi:hypothetical protein
MSFSPNLTYFVERMQGVSVNTFRLESQNRTNATAGQIITFDLPSNAIINLRSLKVWCNANADQVAACGARLPPINSLVERCEVSVGGVVLAQGANYVNVLGEVHKALGYDDCDPVYGHPEYVRSTSYVDGSTFATTANESYVSTDLNYFAIDKFHGFINTAEPKLLDTSIVPDLRVRLYMASNSVLTKSGGTSIGNGPARVGPPAFESGFCEAATLPAPTAAYQLTDIHATIECIGLASMSYDAMLSAQMSQAGFLEIPYKDYNSFQEIHNGSTRFSVATQSLDRVWVSWRDTTFETQANPITVNGYKTQGAFIPGTYATNAAPATGTNIDLGLPQYDVGGVLNTNNEKYKSKYFNFTSGANSGMTMQLQLNGAYLPQFPANLGELYGITKNSLPFKGLKNVSFDQYLNNYCIQCFRLNMPDSEYSRTISGLDTRAVNLAGVVKTTRATAGDPIINVFTEQTSCLRVGAGRSIEVIS